MCQVGQVIKYICTEEDLKLMKENPECNEVRVLPAIIVRSWNNDCVNLKVLLDGIGELWKTSIIQGNQEGNWLY